MRALSVCESGALRNELLLFFVFALIDLTASKALVEDVERDRGGPVFAAGMPATSA